MTAPSTATLSITVTGEDRPGVTGTLLSALSDVGAEVLDIQQVVVHGHLTLALVLRPGVSLEPLRDAAAVAAHRLGLTLTVVEGTGDNARPRHGRAAVVVLGAPLGADAVSLVTSRIGDHGANIDRIRRLSRYPVTTVEFDISGADVPSLRTELTIAAATLGIDIAVAPGGLARRGRRLVVLDVDSTLIQQEVIEMLAAHSGREAEVAAVTARAMAGELDFEASLRARVATLAGLPASVLDAVRDAVVLTPGARTLVRTLKRLGFTVGLVSGGFIEIVGVLADDLGIDHARANRLEVENGVLTGRVVGEVVDRAGKAGPCATSPSRRTCRSVARWPSETAPTTSTCSTSPASGWPSTPSRSCANGPRHRSTCRTSTRCSTCSASPARRSRRPISTTARRPWLRRYRTPIVRLA